MSSQSGFTKVFYGVPMFAGALWRATKAPSLVLLTGFLGVPIILTVLMFTYYSLYHSMVPATIFHVASMRYLIWPAPIDRLPPNTATMWNELTSDQRDMTGVIAVMMALFGLMMVAAVVWWIQRFIAFIKMLRQEPNVSR